MFIVWFMNMCMGKQSIMSLLRCIRWVTDQISVLSCPVHFWVKPFNWIKCLLISLQTFDINLKFLYWILDQHQSISDLTWISNWCQFLSFAMLMHTTFKCEWKYASPACKMTCFSLAKHYVSGASAFLVNIFKILLRSKMKSWQFLTNVKSMTAQWE